MKSAIVIPQEEANIEKILSVTVTYIHRLEIQQQTFFHIGFPLRNEGIGPI